MFKAQTSLITLGIITTLSACGGADMTPVSTAPVGPLFVAGIATPKTTKQSDERSMTGTQLRSGLIPSLSPIVKGNGTSASVAYDGFRLTLIDGTGSKTYDLDAGAGSVKRYGRPALVNGNGDYAAILVGDHSAAATYVERDFPLIKLGAVSVGNITQDMNGAPATASYSGTLNGQFVAGSTTPYDTHGNATLATDFTNGTYAFSADAPTSYNTLNGNLTNAAGLTMTGSGTISGADFSGNAVTTAGMTGTMSGNFYGPNAEEAGGTIGVVGAAGEFVGAFNVAR